MEIPFPLHITAHTLQTLFLIGAAGCMISIPIIAVKFAAVLFEKDDDQNEESDKVPEDDEANYGAVDERPPKK